MNRSKLISATTAAVLASVSFSAIAQPAPIRPAELSAAAAPKPAMKPGSDTIGTAPAPGPFKSTCWIHRLRAR